MFFFSPPQAQKFGPLMTVAISGTNLKLFFLGGGLLIIMAALSEPIQNILGEDVITAVLSGTNLEFIFESILF